MIICSCKDKDAELGRDIILEEKGFFIYPSELFENVRKKAANDGNLNETLEKIVSRQNELRTQINPIVSDLEVNAR